eukprot:COSAG04_NODE_280_length_18201_cov_5.871119_6_plen_165_part_00
MGSAISTLQVAESVFDTNAVRKKSFTDTNRVDLTVRLNTGGFVIPNLAQSDDYQIPIWRVDDGPVYGIPWERCQGAVPYSEDAIRKGLAPSWPNLECANVSYAGPDGTYSRVLSLTEGTHTLWTGLLVLVRICTVCPLKHVHVRACGVCRVRNQTLGGKKPGLR